MASYKGPKHIATAKSPSRREKVAQHMMEDDDPQNNCQGIVVINQGYIGNPEVVKPKANEKVRDESQCEPSSNEMTKPRADTEGSNVENNISLESSCNDNLQSKGVPVKAAVHAGGESIKEPENNANIDAMNLTDGEKECIDSEYVAAEHLGDYIKTLENDVLTELERVLEDVLEDEKTSDADTSSISEELENQCSEIKLQIDIAKKEMLHDLSIEREKRRKHIKEKKEGLLKQEKRLRELLNKCKENLENGGEEMQNFFHNECPRQSEFCFSYSAIKTSFETGVIDIPELRKEIGTLLLGSKMLGPPLKTTLVSFPDKGLLETCAEVLMRFNTHNIIQDIRTTNSGDAWISDEDSHYIVKYNSTGEILKQVNSTCNNECLVVDKDGNFLVCNYWEDRIMKVTQDGDVSILIRDLPAPPTGICINHEDDIVVCMKDHRWIPIYSPDGKTKKKQMSIREPSNKNNDDEDDVFVGDEESCRFPRAVMQIDSPYRIVQNHRRDYIVVDGKFRYQVICLDENGHFRWKYTCQQLEDVYPYNICCTKDDDIIIADVEAQRFHVINSEGQFVTYIMFKELGMEDAWSLSMDNTGRLWSGQDDGVVNIIDLNLGLRPY